MMGFAASQPIYAAHGIPTFPVRIEDKKPAVTNYQRVGLPASRQLVRRFHDATAFGFVLGKRNGITVLDSDSADEKVFADALSRHGDTPFKVRSGSGHFQAWFKHGGEGRHIRPNPELPIDVLGSGYLIAPPSQGRLSQYQIIAGSLDDLDQLPTLQNFVAPKASRAIGLDCGLIPRGARNRAIWDHCMRQAPYCDDFAQLLDVARTFADNECEKVPLHPVTDEEIATAAASAWRITEAGNNRYSDHAAVVSVADAQRFISDPEFLGFLTWLKAQNGPDASFLIADKLAAVIGFSMPLLRRCRNRGLDEGLFHRISAPHTGQAAVYRWGDGLSKSKGLISPKVPLAKGGSVSEDSLSESVGLTAGGGSVITGQVCGLQNASSGGGA